METVNEIKKLMQNANEIYSLFLRKIPKWKSDSKYYDKVGWGFNLDDRFNACKPVSVAFSSHMGTYGNSGCGRECDLDDKLFREHLVKYLNKNKEVVMLAIADQIKAEAIALKEKATAELTAEMEKINGIKEIEKI